MAKLKLTPIPVSSPEPGQQTAPLAAPDMAAVDTAMEEAQQARDIQAHITRQRMRNVAKDVMVALIYAKGTTTSIQDVIKRAFDTAEAFEAECGRKGL